MHRLGLEVNYAAITPRLRQNERNRAFGMLVAENQCKRVAGLFCCSRVVVHNHVRRYNYAENKTIAAP